MGLLSFFTPAARFKRRLYKIRKKWDRLREKIDKKNPPSKQEFLERLDRVEQDIRTLEEKSDLNKWARKKMASEVELELEKIKEALKAELDPPKEEEELDKISEIEEKIKEHE